MPNNDHTRQRPSAPVNVHPAPLNELAQIFDRRGIAVGIDSAGQVVLVRPDSVLARVSTAAERESLAGYVGQYDEKHAARIRGRGDDEDALPYETLRVPDVAGEQHRDEPSCTPARAQQLITELAQLDPSIEAEFNHVVFGEQVVKGNPLGAPATWAGELAFLGNVVKTPPDKSGVQQTVLLSTAEPAEQPRNLRPRLNLADRRKPRILVLDTGLQTVVENGRRRAKHEFLGCCIPHAAWRDPVPGPDGRFPVDDEDEADDDKTKTLDFEAGHGTFIAGVIGQICPDAEVHTAGVLSSFGDGDVDGVLTTLKSWLETNKVSIDIVVMSFGTFLTNDEPGLFGESLQRILGRDVLAVAAAGNQASCRPFFPAALPTVKGVGAVTAAGRAWFSNFGGWVDACAPGVDVVSTFLDYSEDLTSFADTEHLTPRTYEGWASWSGTSFSAPKVAAVLAQEMYLNLNDDGTDLISAREAWRRLSTPNHLRVPDLGVVFNV